MRSSWLYRLAEAAVFAAALAAITMLVWVATLAAQRRPVPAWVWISFGVVCLFAGALMVLQGGRHGNPDGTLRHSSGELVVIRGYRERRGRGTRIALDWKYNARAYMFVPVGLLMALFAGVALLEGDAWWKQFGGALVVIAVLVATGALVRWLLLPVDPDSRAALEAYYDDMRWDWGWIGRRIKSLRHRRDAG